MVFLNIKKAVLKKAALNKAILKKSSKAIALLLL